MSKKKKKKRTNHQVQKAKPTRSWLGRIRAGAKGMAKRITTGHGHLIDVFLWAAIIIVFLLLLDRIFMLLYQHYS